MKRIIWLIVLLAVLGIGISIAPIENVGCAVTKQDAVIVPTQVPMRQAMQDRYIYDCGVTLVTSETHEGNWKRTDLRLSVKFLIFLTHRQNIQENRDGTSQT